MVISGENYIRAMEWGDGLAESKASQQTRQTNSANSIMKSYNINIAV